MPHNWVGRALCNCQLATSSAGINQVFTGKNSSRPRQKDCDNKNRHIPTEDIICTNFPVRDAIDQSDRSSIQEHITNRFSNDEGVFEGLVLQEKDGIYHVHRDKRVASANRGQSHIYELYIPEILYNLLGCRIKHDLRCSQRGEKNLVWTHCIDDEFVPQYKTRAYRLWRGKIKFVVDSKVIGNTKFCLCNTSCSSIAAVQVAENVVIWVGEDCRTRFFKFDQSSIVDSSKNESFETFDDILTQFSFDHAQDFKSTSKRKLAMQFKRTTFTDQFFCKKKRRVENISDDDDLDLPSDEDWH